MKDLDCVSFNYGAQSTASSANRLRFEAFCRTDKQLDENILSRDEYARALKGKRHFRDERA